MRLGVAEVVFDGVPLAVALGLGVLDGVAEWVALELGVDDGVLDAV